ncbi:uncharacterized protein LOC132098517, partial [Carassius carassius]|uniref:uncharacterized protein LOC132098517 n=1 Tax=Carassius carassius TaxID=217509 RepID=UPI002869461A
LGAKIGKPTSLKLPKIELVKSEVNVPLQCSIQNELERRGGEHRLYWFKHGSGEYPPGSIYVHGNTSDGCVGRSEADCLSPTCIYNLPKKMISSSQTGTYCALATCGEILFGNVSKHSPDNFESQNILLFIKIGLAAPLAISFTINILLCCMRKNGRKSQQIQTTNEDDDDGVNYFTVVVGHIIQLDPVVSVHEGDSVVLSCVLTTKQLSMALWYKQVTGEEPRLIASSVLHSSESQFHNEFDSSHFNVLRGKDSFNLRIVNTVQSDWGTYYCAFSFSNVITFGNGTHLVIKAAKIGKPTSLKLPKIELVKSEVNVPLQCSIQIELERREGEHRLYWFKHGSGEYPPGSIYVHGNTSDGCVGRSEADCLSPTCIYNLPKKMISSSQTGTYCALATCGEILFGNISKHNPGLTIVPFITEFINATENKYKQIKTTDDDVSVTEYEEVNFWSSPVIAKCSKS